MSTKRTDRGVGDRVRLLMKPGLVSLLVGVGIFSLHLHLVEPEFQQLLPVTVYNLRTEMSFEGQDDDFFVSTFLPENSERQHILEKQLESGSLAVNQSTSESGTRIRWASSSALERIAVSYTATLALKGIRYEIDPEIAVPFSTVSGLEHALAETPAVQFNHPEIVEAWNKIKPEEKSSLLDVLRVIYDFTANEIEGAEFKGYTDALTALRLRQASCNGKGRLFAALARLNRIPARLVGGVVLNQGSKKTSHQWLEVFIEGKWVPFDPTNKYFAEIPSHYLTLYRGDEALFSHTRNINFDYSFDIDVKRSVGQQTDTSIGKVESSSWLGLIFDKLKLDSELSGTFLLFPLAALVVSLCRNVVGLNSFGIFLPMLIGAACRYTGLWVGITGFLLIIGFASAVRRSMESVKLLQIPRLSALITIITVFIILLIWVGYERVDTTVTALVLFPVIILSFTAERMNNVIEETSLKEGIELMLSTLLIVYLCFLTFSSKLLHGIFLTYPELLLVVLAFQLLIGGWSGFRVSEFFRFRKLIGVVENQSLSAAKSLGSVALGVNNKVLGINARNIELVDRLNSTEDVTTANDKLLTKTVLTNNSIPVPRTLAIVHDFWDLQAISRQLPHWYSFVVKPCMGARGNGILVVQGRDGEDYLLADGSKLSKKQLLDHLREIVAGVYTTHGERDLALVETLIQPTPFYQQFTSQGLSDIRVILVKGEVLAAMLRIPTKESSGRANLHQGAIGVPINLDTGITGEGYLEGEMVLHHPDSGEKFAGHHVPNWDRILEIGTEAQAEIPLGYIGVDIADDVTQGPLVIEVNARPGLEIQNVHGYGFKNLVDRLLQNVVLDGGEMTESAT